MTKLEVGFQTDPEQTRNQFEYLLSNNNELRSVIRAFDELARDYGNERYPQFWRLTLERNEGA